jgi:hypothetical protein
MNNTDLFGNEVKTDTNNWENEWVGMPEYNNYEQKPPFITATFKFRNQQDFDKFYKFVKENLYNNEKPFDGMQRKDVKSTWFPLNEKPNKYLYTDES